MMGARIIARIIARISAGVALALATALALPGVLVAETPPDDRKTAWKAERSAAGIELAIELAGVELADVQGQAAEISSPGGDAPLTPTLSPRQPGGEGAGKRQAELAGAVADSGGLIGHRNARLRLSLHDRAGAPLDGAEPAAWMRRRRGAEPEVCGEQVARFLSGDFFSRADIDFNVYYILALNHDATISVVDPLFGFGGSRVLALVLLESPGADWVLSDGPNARLFVSQPDAGKVAVVRTDTWEVERQLDVGPGVSRLRLQADGAFVWALDPDGLTAIDTRRGEISSRIATRSPGEDFVLDEDVAWVLEPSFEGGESGGVEAIELVTRRSLGRVVTGEQPTTIDVSAFSGAVWIGHRIGHRVGLREGHRDGHREGHRDGLREGHVTAVELAGDRGARAPRLRQRIEAEMPVESLRFAPGGRLAFVLSPEANTLAVLDTARGRIVQRGPMAGAPDQVAFSGELAYIRDRSSEQILMVPLDAAGVEGAPIQAADFPGGRLTPSPAPGDPRVFAPSFVRAPGASAMVVANARDAAIYFYMEGMAAPMGHFTNQGRRPLAVQVVDRSLRPAGPGLYETVARLEEPGTYELAVFLDAPRLVECFTVEVAPEPSRPDAGAPRLRLVEHGARLLPDGVLALELEGLADDGYTWPDELILLANRVAGGWHRRLVARRVDAGDETARFRAHFMPGPAGDYLVWSEAESRGAPLLHVKVPASRVSGSASGSAAP